MTTPAQPSITPTATTFTVESALPSIDAALLEAVVGGCAACGTPGQPCAPGSVGGSNPAAASIFAQAFAQR